MGFFQKKKIWLGVLAVFVFSIILVKSYSPKNNISGPSLERNPIVQIAQPSPTPFPFQEITIPYLRQRIYDGSLGESQKNYENQSYTAFLTSYSSDGLKINGLLTQPKGQAPPEGWPAIVFIHGYIPPRQYQTIQNYYDYVDYLARNGLVVFKIDLRGNGSSEGEAGGAYYSADYVIDVLNAYSALQSSSFVNPDSIGLWGHSMAGNVVMRSFAVKPEISAVVIFAGAVYSYLDMREFGINDASYQPPGTSSERARRRQKIRDIHGEPNADHFFWQQIAPTSFLNDLKGAIQIHHAINDPVVNIGYSRNLISLLDKTNVPHELQEYSSGGHNLSGSAFNEAMDKTVEFFKKYL